MREPVLKRRDTAPTPVPGSSREPSDEEAQAAAHVRELLAQHGVTSTRPSGDLMRCVLDGLATLD
ncbi:hypothetical protein [Amycolatopsis sp.]|uniref:hypothetical protein n=1 Tax=Amycolatopsis sp. TaxID=37632 RepID=UPI0026211129|nr:hypothetical protein [Amycolatopsis sp.]